MFLQLLINGLIAGAIYALVASGEITFDENGDIHREYTFKTIKNGEFVPYEEK